MQRITTRKTINMITGEVLENESFWYSGPVEQAKGDASKAEQASADQQRTLEDQLMQQQLSLMQGQLTSVNQAVDPIIQSIIRGQTPPVLQPLESSLTASYMNQLPNTYRNMMGTINQNLLARGLAGGTNAGGGGVAGDFGALAAALGAQQQQGALDTAQIMNQQKMGLLQNDLGMKLGIANQYGSAMGNFNQGATGALNAGVTAAGNVDQAQSSWMGPVFGGLAGLGGQAITKWCWIGAELYGSWNDPRVTFVRLRLLDRARNELKFKLITTLYRIFGKSLAHVVRRSQWARAIAQKVFDGFIRNEADYILNKLVHE